jgi:Peptidase family M23
MKHSSISSAVLLICGVTAGVALAGIRLSPPLLLTGASKLKSVDPDGGEQFSLELSLRNSASQRVSIRRAELFLASEGGWSWSLGEQISKNGNFFGYPPSLAPSSTIQAGNLNYGWSAPAAYFLIGLEAASAGETQESLFQIPITRPGSAAPAPLPSLEPVYVGLQEPLEALLLATGEKWLTIVGQIINSTGKPLTLTRWRMRLMNARGAVVFDQDLISTFQVRNSAQSLNEFEYGFALPAAFVQGTLNIDAEYAMGRERHTLTRNASVRFMPAAQLLAPTRGLWNWGNGPGELAFHTHYHWPEQRFAYDMGVKRNIKGNLQTYAGDPGRNESYFCWKQPIHAMADGVVRFVYDRAPDNFGNRENPANNPKTNNRIVVEHKNNRFSIYVHVCQGCARVREGQKVSAGDELGLVGNAGFSSEPHLHVAYFTIDPTGRVRALPMAFEDLSKENGASARGVPHGSEQYLAR